MFSFLYLILFSFYSEYKSTMEQYQQLVHNMKQRKVHHRGADLHDWSHQDFIGLAAHQEEALQEICGQEVGRLTARARGAGE
jgi:hypothetical protein